MIVPLSLVEETFGHRGSGDLAFPARNLSRFNRSDMYQHGRPGITRRRDRRISTRLEGPCAGSSTSLFLVAGIMDPPGPAARDRLLHARADRGGRRLLLPEATVDDLPDREGWAIERVRMATHSGTHLDAPYHYSTIMDLAARTVPGRSRSTGAAGGSHLQPGVSWTSASSRTATSSLPRTWRSSWSGSATSSPRWRSSW